MTPTGAGNTISRSEIQNVSNLCAEVSKLHGLIVLERGDGERLGNATWVGGEHSCHVGDSGRAGAHYSQRHTSRKALYRTRSPACVMSHR